MQITAKGRFQLNAWMAWHHMYMQGLCPIDFGLLMSCQEDKADILLSAFLTCAFIVIPKLKWQGPWSS